MPNTKTAAAPAVKGEQEQLKVVELVRRQGIYTGTLQITDVKEVQRLLDGFDGASSLIAKMGAKVTEVEFQAKGGRKGTRDYCLRLPNIKIEELQKIGFEKTSNPAFFTHK